MNLTTKVTRKTHISYWIQLWNGALSLTEKEITLLSELLYRVMDLKEKGIQEPYVSELLFNSKSMKDVKEKLGLSKQSLHNYKKSLTDKGVLIRTSDGIRISEKMIPGKSITFKFEYGE